MRPGSIKPSPSLLEAFIERYLLRGGWSSRALMIQRILNSQRDDNQHFAHPFEWQWSCRDFKYWLNDLTIDDRNYDPDGWVAFGVSNVHENTLIPCQIERT
jgi:hypothetical protein